MKNDPIGLAKSLREIGTGKQPSLWNNLSNIATPVLLLTGEDDKKFVSIAEEMKKKCMAAEMKIIKNCGHAVHFEKPEDFIREINRFFK
jgi:2-succinyl-6-hydroxy-2,4-cyclohexadiene-1-carboxylate synthase